jgi:MFS family permease
MEPLLERSSGVEKVTSFWSSPSAWLREKNLSKDFWVFFAAAFFFDAGFSVYFFLFNLYLLDFGFKERAIGLVGGAFTLGSLVGTLPAGAFTRRFGLRKLLLFCFVAAPLVNAVRTAWMWEAAQIVLAFLSGVAMCTWGVCFLPAVARLTVEKNRTAAFSLIFSVSIGTSALGGVVCGYLQKWLKLAGYNLGAAEVKRLILLVSCAIAITGLFAVLRLRLPSPLPDDPTGEPQLMGRNWFRGWKLHPFLLRFLPLMALWSAVIAAFAPFANVYLERNLHVPLFRIGLIFSTAQIVQLCLGLLTPVVFRRLGLLNGIVVTQIAAAIALAWLAGARDERLAVALYLSFSAAQWMSAPGLYNLLMSETPDKQRSVGAAMTLFCNALAGSAATAGAGILFGRFGYPPVLLGIAMLALAVALLFRLLMAKPAVLATAPAAAPGPLGLDDGGVAR